MLWVMHSGIVAAIAVVAARYVGFFVPLGDVGVRVVAIGTILLLSAVNYVGVRQGSAVLTFFTVVKVLAIGAILGAVVAFAPERAASSAAAAPPSVRDVSLALGAGLFAFGGWHMVTYAAGETQQPQRTIPRALVSGTLIVTLCYLGLNAAYLHVLPVDEVIRSQRVATDVATVLLGPPGAAAVSALVVVSAVGALGGIILAGPRVYFAMARDGLFFRAVGALHPRFETPHRALVLQAAWSSLLVATGTYRQLFTRVIYTEWIFFALLAGGLFVLRRRAGYAPAYRMFGHPYVPLVFITSALVVVFNQVASEPVDSALGLLVVLAGLPVYALWTRLRPRLEPGGGLTDADR
jgi:APA family basic amino acid/polyamine antiporter